MKHCTNEWREYLDYLTPVREDYTVDQYKDFTKCVERVLTKNQKGSIRSKDEEVIL